MPSAFPNLSKAPRQIATHRVTVALDTGNRFEADANHLRTTRRALGVGTDEDDAAKHGYRKAHLAGSGGPSRNRTGVRGFAVLYVTTPPSGLVRGGHWAKRTVRVNVRMLFEGLGRSTAGFETAPTLYALGRKNVHREPQVHDPTVIA